ncbi:Uncharacterised protein [Acinetobacter baumannii]|nr:Uncharacterised protein [Acinetobacter baumannii]
MLIERMIDHQPGHQFGQAGRIAPLVGIAGSQHLAGGVIHQYVRGGIYRRWGHGGKMGRRFRRLRR